MREDIDKEIEILELYIIRCIEENFDKEFIDLLIIRLHKLYEEKIK